MRIGIGWCWVAVLPLAVGCHPCSSATEWQTYDRDSCPECYEEGVFPVDWTPDVGTLRVVVAGDHAPEAFEAQDDGEPVWTSGWEYDARLGAIVFHGVVDLTGAVDVCGEPLEVMPRLPPW